MTINDTQELEKLYGNPSERAIKKELSALDKHCKNFIEHSPFVLLSSVSDSGKMDVSPRGGEAGFVQILDNNRIVFPDFKGNNRLDNLKNIVQTGRAGLLFLIPGIDETLRLNGSAVVSTDEKLLALFDSERNPPKTVTIVEVEEVFLHCAKALMRSKLWDADSQIDPKDFPTMGQMLKDQIGANGVPESREDMVERYKPDL